MNIVEEFVHHAYENPTKIGLWISPSQNITYGDLLNLSARAQRYLIRLGINSGDSVLLAENIGPRLYATIIALLGLGATVAFVEPWMPISKIAKCVEVLQPRGFCSGFMGMLWGARVGAIRKIPKWIFSQNFSRDIGSSSFQLEAVGKQTPGIVVFSSGTSGTPKGIVRTHNYLRIQHETVIKYLGNSSPSGTDLIIFPNVVLSNLLTGRSSVLVSSSWQPFELALLDRLPSQLVPETLVCGPAFLERIVSNTATISGLKTICVGGALTDCKLFEAGFKKWNNASWHHVYGSSEAEPVALADARSAVRESRKQGYYQTLNVGVPIPELKFENTEKGLWISGDHVAPKYLGNDQENLNLKRVAEDGSLWHFMGDKISIDDQGWWYLGRHNQNSESFLLEQRIYSVLDSSSAFLHTSNRGELILIGDNVAAKRNALIKEFPQISKIIDHKIVRDRRHRARIDRALTLKAAKL